MLINNANLNTLFIAFQAAFAQGLGQAQSDWRQIATEVPSSTAENEYGWLGQLPNMREWLGDRVVHAVGNHGYSIKNKSHELTVAVPRTAIEDDQYGTYTPLFTEMGSSVEAHPDQQVFGLLKGGDSALCFDGQNFFDTDHPVLTEAGGTTTVSNWGGGAGAHWFLLDTTRSLKPLIFQRRKAPQLVRKDRPEDDNVFDRAEFKYGVDSRDNVGFGFWQLAYGSRQALDADSFAAAYNAITTLKGDYGRPLGIRPNLLVVSPSLRWTALELLKAERNAAGATNIYRDAVDLLAPSWLA